jgi:hypothetical protein
MMDRANFNDRANDGDFNRFVCTFATDGNDDRGIDRSWVVACGCPVVRALGKTETSRTRRLVRSVSLALAKLIVRVNRAG